jgi:hypothetical protein
VWWCGQEGGELNADHIIPFSRIIERLKFNKGIENLVENCLKDLLFLDISNGRTLCFKIVIKKNRYLRKIINVLGNNLILYGTFYQIKLRE